MSGCFRLLLRRPENRDCIGAAVGGGKLKPMAGFEHSQKVGNWRAFSQPKIRQNNVGTRSSNTGISSLAKPPLATRFQHGIFSSSAFASAWNAYSIKNWRERRS